MFKLHLSNSTDVRIALYDPYTSALNWEDTNEQVILSSQKKISKERVFAVSPQTPGKKSRSLKRIKLQLGFACNYTCTYCSQNNQRALENDKVKQVDEKVLRFFEKMPDWYDGGEDNLGAGTLLEFWGGETLLYWSSIKLLTEKLRQRYPNIRLSLFTNGSIVKKEMVDYALLHRIQFIVSHDGPTFNEDRAKDPFEIPSQAENLHYLFNKLNPERLMSFNATISPKNYSLVKIREYIAQKLGVDKKLIRLTNDLVTPYDAAGLEYVSTEEKRRELINNIYADLLQLYPFDMSVGFLYSVLYDFCQSIANQREASSNSQKCGMDTPESIALDIDGNVLTCQNVTVKGGHKIGHIDDFDNIALTTAFHWSKREECLKCPVVQICKGACMFLQNELWTSACDQHFTWGLAQLSVALFLETGRKLTKIEGAAIRNNSTQVLEVLYS